MALKKTKLAQIRIQKQISQDDVANSLGISQSTYSRKERGFTNISPIEWNSLAQLLGIQLKEIYESSPKNILTSRLSERVKPEKIEQLTAQIDLLKKENELLKDILKNNRKLSKFPKF